MSSAAISFTSSRIRRARRDISSIFPIGVATRYSLGIAKGIIYYSSLAVYLVKLHDYSSSTFKLDFVYLFIISFLKYYSQDEVWTAPSIEP